MLLITSTLNLRQMNVTDIKILIQFLHLESLPYIVSMEFAMVFK